MKAGFCPEVWRFLSGLQKL